jgi:NitT/TauT family transport system permease protein
MFTGILLSLLFTLTVGTAAAKSTHAERLLIPLIDVLQSIPVLGFLSVSVWGFIAIFPNSMLGPECAAIFAIFTSQVWNMTLSFYQSLKTIPENLKQATTVLGLSNWQKFWRLEVPHAFPSLLWNAMLSMSAGWFFVVASEAITVANQTILLPGIGSYIAVAVSKADMSAIYLAITTMFIVIIGYDQLIFRPMVYWTQQLDGDTKLTRPWLTSLLQYTQLLKRVAPLYHRALDWWLHPRWRLPHSNRPQPSKALTQLIWLALVTALIVATFYFCYFFVLQHVSFSEILHTVFLGAITATRIFILIGLCVCLWLPIGVWIGRRPALATFLQPIIQFLASFPANLLFPVVVVLIVRNKLNVDIWTSPLIVLGTQWYILFNVIAGTQSLPKSILNAAQSFHVSSWLWWRRICLPAIFPHLITGTITAVGGAWNASILAEFVQWGNIKLVATGLGAYIAKHALDGDFTKLALGIIVMCAYVLTFNHLLWQPLYKRAERQCQRNL